MKRKGRTLNEALLTGTVLFAGHVEVVGGFYHGMWEQKADGKLAEGAWLRLQREPNNIHDKHAIAVYAGKVQVGYIAKEQAQKLSAFMDAGSKVAARVLLHSGTGQPMRMTARLYVKKQR